ncbi:class I SAM-dependent methyltransferase [Aquimarina aquimarini]|uniref:class I SAM-dependent methyltransferase n=1 Tax=Aquimarina aquimarini TaxID=1191734 RepID=UPI000D55B438|nr:class I SAM-dependent methyltransferase [Aquimarina aquimarini]
MNDHNREIIEITSIFLENNDNTSLALASASKKYKKLLLQLSELDIDKEECNQHIHTTKGKALATIPAANCIDDFMRTKQFILGTYNAINSLLTQSNQNIHILYAGTGPFAALLLPSMLRFSKENIKYTLMDINSTSLHALKKILAKLELDKHTIELIHQNATKYQIPHSKSFDIIISETMQAGLAREPQVSIFLNLMRQSSQSTLFIPEKIEIFLGHKTTGIPIEEIKKEDYKKAVKIFEVSKEALNSYINTNTEIENSSFDEVSSILKKSSIKNSDLLLLLTEINIFGNQTLRTQESGLTLPLIIDNISEKKQNDIIIKSSYKIDKQPRFEYQIVSQKS